MTESQARRIASEWHGGKSSALYAFASSGTILDTLEREIRDDLKESTEYQSDDELSSLLDYVKEHAPMTGLYRTEIFTPGCLNDGDEWFDTEADALAYADEWNEYYVSYERFYACAPGATLDGGIGAYRAGWISNGVDNTGTTIPVSYRVTVSHYPNYAWCPLCDSGMYDTTERDECESCWTYQQDAADRETE